MIHLVTTRDEFTDEYTIGTMSADGEFLYYTLEDPVRDHKIKGITAIPAGTYKGIVNMSNRFKKMMPLLLDVPGFEGVRIHSGNTAKDTEGCILIGLNKAPGMIYKSRPAFFDLMLKLKGQPFTITIK
jgi:hypothetical protein